jgi:hypothetical protein
MRAPLDRRVAVIALVTAAVASLLAIVTMRGSSPGDHDRARQDLLTFARRSERSSWLVDFDFTRTLANGQHLTQRVTEANRPPIHIASSASSVTVDFGDRVASCTTTGTGAPQCIEQKEGATLASWEVYREVIRLGAYGVERRADRTIAHEQAHCFTLVARGSAWPQLGAQTEQCYASDGIPLRSEVRRGGAVDAREAVRVNRRATAATLRELLARLERDQAAGTG